MEESGNNNPKEKNESRIKGEFVGTQLELDALIEERPSSFIIDLFIDSDEKIIIPYGTYFKISIHSAASVLINRDVRVAELDINNDIASDVIINGNIDILRIKADISGTLFIGASVKEKIIIEGRFSSLILLGEPKIVSLRCLSDKSQGMGVVVKNKNIHVEYSNPSKSMLYIDSHRMMHPIAPSLLRDVRVIPQN